MVQSTRLAHVAISAWFLLSVICPKATCAEIVVSIVQGDGKATVLMNGKLFTEYVYEGHVKPILYPIVGPHGVKMTRHHPMVQGVDNEANDHPHHESLWFTHDGVNGANFWSAHTSKAKQGRTARAVQTDMEIGESELRTENEWRDADDNIVCTDSRVLRFGTWTGARYIDYRISIHATRGDVTFADTKEGTMAIRTHPLLRISSDKKHGNHTVAGHAINSEGHTDGELWGKRAKWVDYWAPVEGKTVGIAIFDHPQNPRHPTWWHARNYGLVAANPFGVHDFEKKPEGTGDMLIQDGSSVTFRYRFVFHEGDAETAKINDHYAIFASTNE